MTKENNEKLNKEIEVKVASPDIVMPEKLPSHPLPPKRPLPANAISEEKPAKKKKIKKIKKNKEVQTEQTPLTEEEIKKNKQKKVKLYIILGSALLGLILITVLTLIIIIKVRENTPLEMSTDAVVEVVAFNNQYFLEVEEDEQAYYYIFEISHDDEPFLIFSKTNQIDVSQYFQQKTTFTIRYYIQKESSLSRSDASQSIEYVAKEQLTTPVIRLNEETNKIEWNYVLNAGSYMFYYANGSEVSTYEFTPPVDDEDNIGSYMPSLEYGIYDISIVAKPTNETYYNASEQSNILEVSNYDVCEQVLSASYSLSEQKVYFDASNLSSEDNQNYAIHIGNQILYFSPIVIQDNYVINVQEYGFEITLGIQVSVVTLGDGEYVLNSPAKICTPAN